MFVATKLRRGMIPKDKERGMWMWNVESREKIMCHHLPWLFCFCWLRQRLAGKKTVSMPRLLSSPRRGNRFFPLPQILAVRLPHAGRGNKMFYQPLCGGSSSLWRWLPVCNSFSSIHIENQLLSPRMGLWIVLFTILIAVEIIGIYFPQIYGIRGDSLYESSLNCVCWPWILIIFRSV